MNILIIEDDAVLSASMATYLAAQATVASLHAAERALQTTRFDVIIIDLALPDGDGLTWLQEWRHLLPAKIIVLTANDEDDAVIKGLALADDYLIKPISLRVLAARIAKLNPPTTITLGHLTIDVAEASVHKDGQVVVLSATEWRFLNYLLTNANILLTRAQLISAVWDVTGTYVNDNTLTVTVKRLREKLEADPNHPQLLRTIRGMGYFFNDQI